MPTDIHSRSAVRDCPRHLWLRLGAALVSALIGVAALAAYRSDTTTHTTLSGVPPRVAVVGER